MQILSQMKAFGQATNQCLSSKSVPQQQKQHLQDTKILRQNIYYGTKLLIVLGFVKLVDWKKQVSIFKREIPVAFFAFGMSLFFDWVAYRYALMETQGVLVARTGFRDGVFVAPDKFVAMKQTFKNKKEGRVYQDDRQDLME